jgi:hypothetical protein
LQAIHATDRSETVFRAAIEAALVAMTAYGLVEAAAVATLPAAVLAAFAVTHTLLWCLTGNYWVYMLDSFVWVRNPGLDKVLAFVTFAHAALTRVDCCEAILIYGSFCRGQFHGRSDLDLRALRRTDSPLGLLALPIGFALRARSFFIMMPVDLQVVDSMDFLRRQMRSDERPIVVYARPGFELSEAGRSFGEVERDPGSVLRCQA